MTYPSLSPFLLLLLLFSSQTQAWTFVWRNESGPSVNHNDTNPAKCVRMYHEKGLEFSWDPEGPWCLKIWGEPDCKNMIGWECEHTRWRQPASRNLSAYEVYPMPKSAVSRFITETGTTSTATSTSMTSTSATDRAKTQTGDEKATATGSSKASETAGQAGSSSTDGADAEGDGGGSLSGGAIAGIVIGAVAGVVVLATVFFLWGRRKPSRAGVAAETQNGTHTDLHPDHGPEVGPGYSHGPTGSSNGPQMTEATTTTTLVASSHSASQYATDGRANRPPVELPGEMGGVELSNSRQLMEMDGEAYAKRSNSIAKN